MNKKQIILIVAIIAFLEITIWFLVARTALNTELNAFIVIELKIRKLKPIDIGQIKLYMNYIDEHLKKFNQDKTIGIIICKQDNKYVIKYCSDDRIIAREYELV